MSNWEEYFFEIAKAVSTKSECLRKHYGAIIVNKDKIIVSTGFNGTPFGVSDCVECHKDKEKLPHDSHYHVCRSIHAEENAIIFAGRERAQGGIMYLFGPSSTPCYRCKRLIINVGIIKVIVFDGAHRTEFNPKDWVKGL